MSWSIGTVSKQSTTDIASDWGFKSAPADPRWRRSRTHTWEKIWRRPNRSIEIKSGDAHAVWIPKQWSPQLWTPKWWNPQLGQLDRQDGKVGCLILSLACIVSAWHCHWLTTYVVMTCYSECPVLLRAETKEFNRWSWKKYQSLRRKRLSTTTIKKNLEWVNDSYYNDM